MMSQLKLRDHKFKKKSNKSQLFKTSYNSNNSNNNNNQKLRKKITTLLPLNKKNLRDHPVHLRVLKDNKHLF